MGFYCEKCRTLYQAKNGPQLQVPVFIEKIIAPLAGFSDLSKSVSNSDTLRSQINVNGNILISPKRAKVAAPQDVMAFAGMGRRVWGQTSDEVEAKVRALRDEWER